CQCFAPVVSAVAWLISSRGLNQPHHITNAALLRGRWHRQKDKNRSPSAKNQSSEIRLSENANKKRAKCEAFHVAPRLFFMFLFLIPFTIRQQSIIYPHNFSTEPENCFFWRRMGLNSAKLSIFAMIIT
ncbi:MAG: hypothetical protein SPE55_07505, partial [Sodaliphilus sp.]|nr:hypothetical protein [Sodaliphilus sp.]